MSKGNTVIRVEGVWKQYMLGQVGTGSIRHDLNRWWHVMRGKEDPYLKIGAVNDRTSKLPERYVWALRDINFQVKHGEVLGIIGRNGAGKSTLLKILSRTTTPTKGLIKVKGRIASLLEVGTGFHPDLTGRENIFLNGAILGMRSREIARKLDEIVDFAGVQAYLDTPVKRYSSGMHVRLAFAVAAHLEPEILIVDEVLAVGDQEFQQKCLGKMQQVSQQEGRTVLFVSHQMNAISGLCHKCLLLDQGQLILEGGTAMVIGAYLNSNKSSMATFDKYLRWVRARQEGSSLVIEAEYALENAIRTPHLGFVIKSPAGVPVTGWNPSVDNLSQQHVPWHRSGKITITLEQPKLMDGIYSLSVWFGDNLHNNFMSAPDCLTFEIVRQTDQKQQDSLQVGNVLPQCDYQLQTGD